MNKILDNIYLLEEIKGCNVYLLVGKDELTLVDTGLKGQLEKIESQLQQEGYSLSRLKKIILTHVHRDHSGSANELAERAIARVYAHQAEAPYLEKKETLPYSSIFQMIIWGIEKRFLPQTPPCPVDKKLEDGDVVDVLGGLRAVHTPGHTPGSLSLYQPERKILFCGDALFNQNPVTGKKGLRLPLPVSTTDKKEALESVKKLSELPVEVILFGHGAPLLEKGTEKIKSLGKKKAD